MSIRDKIEVFVKAELGSYKPLHIGPQRLSMILFWGLIYFILMK